MKISCVFDLLSTISLRWQYCFPCCVLQMWRVMRYFNAGSPGSSQQQVADVATIIGHGHFHRTLDKPLVPLSGKARTL